ncbi:Fur-regulated basic protein FbpA [Bacillus salipaludis]|uniref:Fur-regulated basic protein FbpA n=1 Tax=Bacillus salipaludis TaxID=2547811 RepID=UPI002E1F48F4|nr:Fur-regulated basic protein FbpA [Bacillus salipaludis]
MDYRKGVEARRKILVDKLIAFNGYKKDDKTFLNELTLKELKNEYRKFLSQSHPHDHFGSIQWIYRKT